MKRINNITLGTDPEFFLVDKLTGKYVPAVGLIGGTKHKPKKISEEGHAIQEDNVMLEICVPACRTPEAMYDAIHFTLDHVKKNILPNNLDIAIHASAEFSKEDLNSEQALTMGWTCSPFYK